MTTDILHSKSSHENPGLGLLRFSRGSASYERLHEHETIMMRNIIMLRHAQYLGMGGALGNIRTLGAMLYAHLAMSR